MLPVLYYLQMYLYVNCIKIEHAFTCSTVYWTTCEYLIILLYQAVGKYQPWTFEDENDLQQIGGYYQHYKDMSFVTVKVI